MSAPKPDASLVTNPTPDELAGTPLCIEEAETIARAPKPRPVRVRGGPVHGTPPAGKVPTADELAGIPMTVEGDEDLTVRLRKEQQK